MTDAEFAKLMLVVVFVGVFILAAVCAGLYGLGIIATYQGPCPWLP